MIEQYDDTTVSIKHYIQSILNGSLYVEKYLFKNMHKVKLARLAEHERISSLALLASMEAMLQNNYSDRVNKRAKDELSRSFRQNFTQVKKRRSTRPSLKHDIFPIWKQHTLGNERACILAIENIFPYRHWLAHGRYWTWKHGAMPSFYKISLLAQSLEALLSAH